MITYHVEADNEPTPPSEPRWLVKRQPPEGWMPMPFHLESDADRYTAWLSACNAPEAPTLPTAPSTVPRDQASFEDAIVAAQQTVNLNMSDPQAYIHLSNLLEQRDRPDEAVTVLREALARLFQVTRLYEALVQLLVRQGRLDDAIDVAVSVTGVEAENPQTYALLGHLLTRAGRYGDAEVAIRRALELEPQQIGFFQLLINVLEGMGNLDAAIEAARRVIE